VRLVLASMLLMLAAPRADACPHGATCVATETRAEPVEPAVEIAATTARRGEQAPAGKAMPDLVVRDAADVDMLSRSLRTHVVPRAAAIQMPWIWQVLRSNVYARMPRYDSVDQPDRRFSLVLSPVVVTSPQDTVPGVGIEGDF
jgi:hypothetical protein